MKKLFILLLVLTAGPLWAQKSLEVAYESSGYTYREPAMQYPISLKGRLRGGSLRYETRMQQTPLFAALEGRWMGGTTDYDGWVSTTTYPPVTTPVTGDDIGDYYYEVRLRMGQAYDFTECLQLWVGSGIGYRYLKDHMNKLDAGYLRESTYIYLPVTASVRYNTRWWGAALNGEFDYLFMGKQMSHLSRLGYPDDVRNDQRHGFGVRVSLKIQANILRDDSVFIEPFYRYWQIAESKMAYGFVEPYNTTEEFGIRLGVSFGIGSNKEVFSM